MRNSSKPFLNSQLLILVPVFKKITILLIVFLITACVTSTKIEDNPVTKDNVGIKKSSVLAYQSTANGVADILLNLKKNNTFAFYMKVIPQPMSNEKVSIIKTTGKWSKSENWTRLTFKKTKMDVRALFDRKYAGKNQFKIINVNTVDINDKLNELDIWGVPCVKIKQ